MGLHELRGLSGLQPSRASGACLGASSPGPSRRLHRPPETRGLQASRSATRVQKSQICCSWGPEPLQGASWKKTENVGKSFQELGRWVLGYSHRIYLAHWGGWRQGCASRCTGRARRGSIRPLFIGSSHCLTQYGCIG